TGIPGDDLGTRPDFPAEIRAPAGTLPGVSGYQISVSSRDIRTPGDAPGVLVAMNPAALKTNLGELEEGGILIVDTDAFSQQNLNKAGYKTNPLKDGSLAGYRLIEIPLTTLTLRAIGETTLGTRQATRCKNFFALGLVFWLYERPVDYTQSWIKDKFKNNQEVARANLAALLAGYNYAATTEILNTHDRAPKPRRNPATYTKITGTETTAVG